MLISPQGDQLSNRDPYLVEEKVSESLTICYRRTQVDVGILVSRLERIHGIDKTLLNADYWLASSCTRVDGNCEGDCASGDCQWVSNGNFSYCGCA
jgi:hypothetical protein